MGRRGEPGKSIADCLAAAGGRPYGFDYLRLSLAICVLAFHSFVTTHDIAADHDLWRSSWRAVLRLFVPMFFALSGFLVAGSLVRSATLGEFLALRVLRIVPALLVEVLLCALILGPALTVLPLPAYFTQKAFFTYFLNIIGDVHFALPGVFPNNPRPHLVNGALWTVPFEGACYLVLAVLAVIGIERYPKLLLGGVLAASLVLTLLALPDGVLWTSPGSMLVLCFLAGVTLFLHRAHIPCDGRVFLLALGTTLILLYSDRLVFLAALPLAYVTVWLGLNNPRKTVLLSGDYSYGIYLFSYPIQQACVQLFPVAQKPLGVFLIALPLSVGYALLSWRYVEKPVLTRKKRIIGLIQQNPTGRLRGLISRAGLNPPRADPET